MRYLLINPDAGDYKIMYKEFDNPKNGLFLLQISMKSSLFSNYRLIDEYFNKIDREAPIVIIVAGRVYEKLGNKLPLFIKKAFKNVSLVLYLVDVIPTYLFEIENAKEIFDKVFTFDKRDAKKYELSFCQEPFSEYPIKKHNTEIDLLYIGEAKSRFEAILNAYDSAEKRGLKCLFFVFAIERELQQKRSGIIYNQYVDFVKVLEYVSKSRYLIEFVTEDMYSPTSRFAESVLYEKILISNSPFFKDNKSFSNVYYMDNPNFIDWDKIGNMKFHITEENKKIFSVEQMIKTIGE